MYNVGFQVYSKVNQLCIYPFFLRFFAHVGHSRILSSFLCAILGPCWLPFSFKQAPPISAWKFFWISLAFSWLLYLFTFSCTSCFPCAMWFFFKSLCHTHSGRVVQDPGLGDRKVRSFLWDGEQGHQPQGVDQSWGPREGNSQHTWWGVSRQRKTLLGSETGCAEEEKVGSGRVSPWGPR